MNIRMHAVATVFFMVLSTQVLAQTAGSSVSLRYGTVKSVETVQAQAKHAKGALAGGLAGAVIAKDHRGLGALAGGLIGAGIEGHHTKKDTLQQYTVAMMNGGAVVINTEQQDIVVGDCVVVEQRQYANIRRVSNINCYRSQQPEHHVSAANNCQKAKDELNEAKSNEEVENAVIKVRTLCED
jgi:outer membrane lipoprotein SlyB